MSQPNLLDPNRAYYVIKTKFRSIVITDENGIELGKTKGSSLLDNNGSVILKQNTPFFKEIEINDSNENLIGIIVHREDDLIFLKNSNGDDLLIGEFLSVSDAPYGINNNVGDKIADVTMKGNWLKRYYLGGDKMILHIKDLSCDRKSLLGLVWYMTWTRSARAGDTGIG